MNPNKVKIEAYGRNNFRTLQQGEEGMKGRTAHHPSISNWHPISQKMLQVCKD
jgi:hypothetical protein